MRGVRARTLGSCRTRTLEAAHPLPVPAWPSRSALPLLPLPYTATLSAVCVCVSEAGGSSLSAIYKVQPCYATLKASDRYED